MSALDLVSAWLLLEKQVALYTRVQIQVCLRLLFQMQASLVQIRVYPKLGKADLECRCFEPSPTPNAPTDFTNYQDQCLQRSSEILEIG